MEDTNQTQAMEQTQTDGMKFCKHCGAKIVKDAVICTTCGRQVEALGGVAQPQIVINNANSNVNTNVNTNVTHTGRLLNKWVAFFLCLFFGICGAHKFYEGKMGMGILYLFTGGLLGIGVIVDLIALLMKPNPYSV